MVTADKGRSGGKYSEERDERLRPDGNAQYLQLRDQLAHYLDDPYLPVVERHVRRARVPACLMLTASPTPITPREVP